MQKDSSGCDVYAAYFNPEKNPRRFAVTYANDQSYMYEFFGTGMYGLNAMRVWNDVIGFLRCFNNPVTGEAGSSCAPISLFLTISSTDEVMLYVHYDRYSNEEDYKKHDEAAEKHLAYLRDLKKFGEMFKKLFTDAVSGYRKCEVPFESFRTNDKKINFIWNDDYYFNGYTKHLVSTFKEFAFICEFYGTDAKILVENYGQEFITNLIGTPLDPFTAVQNAEKWEEFETLGYKWDVHPDRIRLRDLHIAGNHYANRLVSYRTNSHNADKKYLKATPDERKRMRTEVTIKANQNKEEIKKLTNELTAKYKELSVKHCEIYGDFQYYMHEFYPVNMWDELNEETRGSDKAYNRIHGCLTDMPLRGFIEENDDATDDNSNTYIQAKFFRKITNVNIDKKDDTVKEDLHVRITRFLSVKQAVECFKATYMKDNAEFSVVDEAFDDCDCVIEYLCCKIYQCGSYTYEPVTEEDKKLFKEGIIDLYDMQICMKLEIVTVRHPTREMLEEFEED